MAERPTDKEISEFLDGLRAYRATIPERQQEMLDVMVVGAIRQRNEKEDAEVKAFWSAYNPPGAAGGYGRFNPPGYGYGYGVPGGYGW